MNWRAYVAHSDPATTVACLVAVVLGLNGPFYPFYIVAVVGLTHGWVAFLTMGATPLFLAIPRLARRAPVAARAALWLVGTINTIWCMKLFGPASGVGVFLLPCIALAVLLPVGWVRLTGTGAPLLALIVPWNWFGAPIMTLTAAQNAQLGLLNEFSAACLTGLLALQLGRFMTSARGT